MDQEIQIIEPRHYMPRRFIPSPELIISKILSILEYAYNSTDLINYLGVALDLSEPDPYLCSIIKKFIYDITHSRLKDISFLSIKKLFIDTLIKYRQPIPNDDINKLRLDKLCITD